MPRWWDKLLGRDEKPPAAPAPAKPEPAKWLAAGDPRNPFEYPILDLMKLLQLIAASEDPAAAARSTSWGGTTGVELDPAPLLGLPPVECSLRYPAARSLPDGILYAPPSMDFKWVLALRDGRLLAARSWSGEVQAIAEARRDGDELVLERLRTAPGSALHLGLGVVPVFDWLIRVHAFDQRLPLPVDEGSAKILESVPYSGFAPFGHALFCAARQWSPPPPPRPLRSDGEVIVAARLKDCARLEGAVKAGADVDAPGTYGGYTALHLSAVRGDVDLLRVLLRSGANAAALADRATHALVIAVVHRAPLAYFDALAESSLDLKLPNADGFTALHAAAEAGRADAVPWLVAHGLPLEAHTRHGHTALHIAAALGHAAAAQALLDAGAELNAPSPGGTPLDVARAENKPELVALLSDPRVASARAR